MKNAFLKVLFLQKIRLNLLNMFLKYILFFFSILPFFLLCQEKKQYKLRTIAFYNVENLFDTINNPNTFDDDRTPTGKDRWTGERYKNKLINTSKVLWNIGRKVSGTAPDIIGLVEIENRDVLQDLLNTPPINTFSYGIIHFDSPDRRGVDVALLYKTSVFTPVSYTSLPLLLKNEFNEREYTRDQLLVSGFMDGEEIHFIVNHWPSRRGGTSKSEPKRLKAALLNKRIIDSLKRIHPEAKIISMGDFNDDPTDASFKRVLKTKGVKTDSTDLLYNPMEMLLRKHGAGSLAYRDRWNLFDQFFFTSSLLDTTGSSLRYWKSGIYNPSYLTVPSGPYKGYPLRTYEGGQYRGGYSDHFPIYMFLLKPL